MAVKATFLSIIRWSILTLEEILTLSDENVNTQEYFHTLDGCLFPSNLAVFTALFFRELQVGNGHNFMLCLWDVRCPSNFQQEASSSPAQISGYFPCRKVVIINLHDNGICQSKGALLKEKCPSCYLQTSATFHSNIFSYKKYNFRINHPLLIKFKYLITTDL